MLQPQEILVERYQLQRVLGESASRQTWLAWDLVNREQVVVKLLIASDKLQWDNLRLFEREAKVLRQLNHPCIPEYRDDFVVKKNQEIISFALVQEYIPAKSLKDLLLEGKIFSETEARKIAIALLKILIYLHKLSPPVLHRDIKPSNVLLSQSKGQKKKIYLVDFGAVQDRAASEGATFTVVGTYGYAPLEQFGGRATPASDLYALGANLVNLVTGIAPADLPQLDSKMQFSHLVKLNPGFVRWLQKMTEPNLEYRFQSASAALEALNINQQAITTVSQDIPDTNIAVSKSSKQLEIHIPVQKKSAIGLILGGIGLFLWIWFIIASGGIYFWTGFLWLILGILLTAWWTLSSRVETTICFDNQNFEIRWKLFDYTLRKQRGNVLEIDNIYSCKTGNQDKQVHEITLSVGVNEYYFGKFKGSLSQEESRYIAAEIRNWLGL
ncbi:serine/threonine-protein kinase [Calothrix sp. UHCC 0171]|uniref:serine/threonine protein kinase n=1 Tax=Calothrix sp. UHCC 0171 TaxID=3110245 RepID=UPI002B1EBD23|nr:serine/threonine-protein kinase [Calothrix sp. UHCC 0171]MEA5571219.1 serine/threonine-protein kinase [Calothrix sp. UHCC 0171]